jgi:hypothetical protein
MLTAACVCGSRNVSASTVFSTLVLELLAAKLEEAKFAAKVISRGRIFVSRTMVVKLVS